MPKGKVMAAKDKKEVQAETPQETSESTPKFNFQYVVSNPFNQFKKGDRISGDENIQKVIDGGHSHNCKRIAN